MPSDSLTDLELLIRSRHGLIHLATDEEERASTLLRHLADRLNTPLFEWTRIRGLSRVDLEGAAYDTEMPAKAFRHIAAAASSAIYHFRDLGPHLGQDAMVAAHMKEAVEALSDVGGSILVTGAAVEFPETLQRLVTTIQLPVPGPDEYRTLVSQLIRDISERQHVEVALSQDELGILVRHMVGLSLLEAEKILTKAIIEDGRLTVDDIRHVIDAKKSVIEREGLLEYYPVEATLDSIADLATLKAWLAKRREVVARPEKAEEFGLAFPRGVLLLGVPGCGKSLSAKAVAAEWRLPLLKLDPSNLYNKYIGESERNFKRAMQAAERMAPVVLWIDEIEKAFATGGSEDGGVSQRILGSFLSWMQDRNGDVFVVATANDISRLPPEFLRKGRFDEIFFVDLPDEQTRSEIFRIHLSNRGKTPDDFDLDVLGASALGFSGSEIEEVVVSGLYGAFSHGGTVTTEALLEEITQTRPLSVTMAEHVQSLRDWARDRAVRAN